MIKAMVIGILAIAGSTFSNANVTEVNDPALWQIAPESSDAAQVSLQLTAPAPYDESLRWKIAESHYDYRPLGQAIPAEPVFYFRFAYQINNSQGLESDATVSVEFDPAYEQVTLHKILLHRGNQTINQLKPELVKLLQRETRMEDGLFDGRQTLTVVLSDQRVGDTVEYSYSIAGQNPVFGEHIFGQNNLQAGVAVEHYYFRLMAAENVTLRTRVFDGTVKPTKTQKNGYQQWVWHNQDVEPSEYQSNLPDDFRATTRVQYSDFPDWDSVRAWATLLTQLPATATRQVQTLAQEIQQSHSRKQSQIEAAIAFVQDNIRYTGNNGGIGGFMPDKPNQTLQRRFGDCKDKSMLLVSLLRELGVHAQPALVHTAYGKTLPQYLPAPTLFDHMIVRVQHREKSYWIDATNSLQGTSLKHLSQANFHHALVVGDNNSTKMSGLVSYTTPNSALVSKEVIEKFELKDNSDLTPTRLTVTSIYRGAYAESQRAMLQSTGRRQVQKNWHEYYRGYFADIEISKDLQIKDNRQSNKLTIIESYNIPSVWTLDDAETGDGLNHYSLDLRAYSILDTAKVPTDRRRFQPLAVRHINTTHRIKLMDEGGWIMEPESIIRDNDAFLYRFTTTPNRNWLELSWHMKTLTDEVSPAAAKRYIKALGNVRSDAHYEIVYSSVASVEKLRAISTGLSQWWKETKAFLKKRQNETRPTP